MESQSSSNEYNFIVEKNVRIPMRDGVNLVSDIYKPTIEDKTLEEIPTILERTPYDRTDPDKIKFKGEYYAKRGYSVVIQDVRGRYDSEGIFYPLKNEAEDGYDSIEWVADQPWSNGKVGLLGTSMGAWVQTAAANLNPPHLSSMFHNQGGFNAHHHTVRHGGAMEMRFIAYAYFMAASSKEAAANPLVDQALRKVKFSDLLTNTPIKKGQTPLKWIPNYEKWMYDWLTKADYGKYWMNPGYNVEERLDQFADMSCYFAGGWYDSYTLSTTQLYTELKKRKKGLIKMIMGPWTHGSGSWFLTHSGEVDFGEDALIDYDSLRLEWFNHTLKGENTKILDEPPIRIFVMGGGDGKKNSSGMMKHGGKWRYENEWPLSRTKYTKYYLHENGRLNTSKPGSDESSTTYQYDPRDPVPSIGANVSSLVELIPETENVPFGIKTPVTFSQTRDVLIPGAYDQVERPGFFGCKPPYLPLSYRDDVLVFETSPLEEDMEVTGPIEVKLWVSSSAKDTDFTAKLIDVHPPNQSYPNGFAMNLTDSIIRARYRNSWKKAEFMKKDEIYKITIIPYPTSNLFKKGHQIRLDISSSNFPRFDINPNTVESIGTSRLKYIAENTIHHNSKYPSSIILPIIFAE